MWYSKWDLSLEVLENKYEGSSLKSKRIKKVRPKPGTGGAGAHL